MNDDRAPPDSGVQKPPSAAAAPPLSVEVSDPDRIRFEPLPDGAAPARSEGAEITPSPSYRVTLVGFDGRQRDRAMPLWVVRQVHVVTAMTREWDQAAAQPLSTVARPLGTEDRQDVEARGASERWLRRPLEHPLGSSEALARRASEHPPAGHRPPDASHDPRPGPGPAEPFGSSDRWHDGPAERRYG
jgi:hypothetical protein